MSEAFVLDTGALIALERNGRNLWLTLRRAEAAGDKIQVPAGVIGQAWRDGSRQAQLARALRLCEEIPLDGARAREVGALCGATDTSDVIDASVALAAARLTQISEVTKVKVLTSDLRDISRLTSALNVQVEFVNV